MGVTRDLFVVNFGLYIADFVLPLPKQVIYNQVKPRLALKLTR